MSPLVTSLIVYRIVWPITLNNVIIARLSVDGWVQQARPSPKFGCVGIQCTETREYLYTEFHFGPVIISYHIIVISSRFAMALLNRA